MEKNNILIATGGTGGHIFPAMALKQALEEMGVKVKLTADARFAKYHPFDKDHILIPALGFTSKSLKMILLTLLTLMHGFLKALYIIYKNNPEIVIGFGGYATYPTMLAAILMGKKIILHEANTVIGKVNRMLLWRATFLTCGFKNIIGVKEKYRHKIINTGNPVRADIVASSSAREKDKLTILIIGGSGGAKIFSKIIPSMVVNLPVDVKSKLYIYQQAKEEDVAQIKQIYATEGVECEIKSFFNDMNDKLAKANLVIARSGASTIAELIKVGLPAILIPLPSSADNHQYYNAKEMADLGANWLVIEEPNVQASILKIVKSIAKDPSILEKHASKLKGLQQDACKNIIETILKA